MKNKNQKKLKNKKYRWGADAPGFWRFRGVWGIAPPAWRNALKTEILSFASRVVSFACVVYCFACAGLPCCFFAQFLPFFVYFVYFQRDTEIFAFSLSDFVQFLRKFLLFYNPVRTKVFHACRVVTCCLSTFSIFFQKKFGQFETFSDFCRRVQTDRGHKRKRPAQKTAYY